MAERVEDRERIAVLEARVEDQRTEVAGIRARMHDLVSRVKAIEYIGDEVKRLIGSVDTLKSELPAIVKENSRQVAQEVMESSMEKREEIERKRWGLRIQWMALGAAGITIILGIIYHFTS